MNLIEAAELLKKGKRIQRFHGGNCDFNIAELSMTEDGPRIEFDYLLTIEDLIADDWEEASDE